MKLKKRLSAIFYRSLILMTVMLPKEAMAQICDIVYVSAAIGNDANTGTAALPVATLSQALTLVGGSRTTIWMAGGSYTQSSIVNVTNGLTVEGGFAVAGSIWTKSTAQITAITFSGVETTSGVRHRIAFKADGVSGWQLKDLSIITTSITGTDPSNRGSSNYGVWVNNCTNYTISRCEITVGNASAGGNGTVGSNGTNGNNGSQGGSGSCDGNYTCCFGSESAPGGNGGGGGQGAVGTAAGATNSSTTNNNPGSSGTGRNGGGGGAGGKGGGFSGGNNAVAGSSGGGSASLGTNNGVGNSGAEGTTGGDGTNGAAGAVGSNGNTGTNGPAGSNAGIYFVPGSQAGTGTDGTGGQGGAGGGGGGRQNGTFVNAGPGNGGGGGGGGGQGAIGGTGGFGGGAVFGIYTTSSTIGADITQNSYSLGLAGNGGIGGAGGTGGAGGAGGGRNTTCTAEIGEGGAGGTGGNGGNGGQGGSGANGISIQLSQNGTGSSPSLVIPVTPTITSLGLGCTNSEITITKGSGTWTLPTGMTFVEDLNFGSSSYNNNSSSAIVSISAIGNYDPNVSGTDYQNYISAFSPRALPTLTASTPTIVCEGNSFPMSTPTSGTQYEWIVIPVSGSTLTPTAIFTTSVASWQTPVTGLTTNYRVRLRVFNNCCGWSAPVYHNFTVISTSVGPLANGDTICTGQTAALSATGSGLGNLTWYADPLGQISLQTSAGASTTFTTPSLTQSAVYYVAESVSGCLTSLTAVQATVAPTPNTPAASSAPVCEGAPVTLNGFGTGGTLSWFNVATGGSALGTGSSFNAGALAAGSYTFYLSESNGSCSSPRTAVGALVNVAPAPPTASGTTICSGNTATLSATASGTVQWYADAAMTTQLGSGASFNTPLLTTNTIYHVAQINAAGCRSTTATPVTVTVTALPAAPSASGTAVCAGNPATLTATAGSGTLTWFADPGGSVSVGTGASFTTPVLNQTTAYYVRETASGCQSPLTQVTATVNALPTAPAGSAPAVCAGASVILNGFGSGGTLSWFNTSTGGTALGSGNNFNAGILAAGSYTFYVEESNGSCSSLRSPVAVVVNAAPAAPAASGTTICSGASATLSATGSGVIQWYADAALTNLLATGSTFNTPALTTNTTYHVAASSSAGCLSTGTSLNVTVTALPAAPVATGATVCAGNPATLTATAGAGTLTWFADPGGSVSVGTGASFTTPVLNQTTAFYVRETASGCQSTLTQVTATVNALPTAPAGTAPAVCAGAPVILNGFGSGGTLSWFNTAIGGTALGSGNNFNAGILAVGSYTFYVEESNGSCSSLRSPVAVVVNAAPAAPTAQNDGPACEGDDIFLQASNVSGASYNWTGPNGFSSNQQTIMIQSSAVSDAGVYSVAAIVNGCASSTASTTVTVNSLPQISGAISNNGPLCEGENLTLTAPTTAGLTYEWTGPNGYSSTQAVSIVNNVNELDQQGFYTLVVTAANGCSSLPLSTLVEITSLPQAGMAISNGPLCTGSTLNLSVAEVFGVSYSWSGPNGFTSTDRTPSVTPVSAADAGIYTVTVSRNNCQTELDVNVVIDTVPNISVIADTTIESSDELMLYASGGIIYQWSPATFLSSPFSPTTIFAGAPAGTYTLTVFIQDAKGCSAEEQVNITVEASDNIVVTDLFTPNGDGVNETWVIEFLNNVGSYTLQVFSRGGLEVLNSQNYTNDWDGTHYKSGKKLPDGTYYYIIRTDANEYSGAVTIKR